MTVLSKELIEKSLVFFALLPLVFGCKTIQYVPVEHTEYVHQLDSVYFRDTVIHYQTVPEYVRDYRGLTDTLVLTTSLAESRAWVDTTRNILAGDIRNLEKLIDIPVQVKEKVVVRDSIVYQDKPVPVEVVKTVHPGYEKWLWIWCIVSALLIGLWAYFKFLK